ncbi:MAG: tetratricopeptide repeat protein, partial [Desulfobulbaceae bacterium]|nr:tetratricopeptide repeat protein [Desulfobulbaceae bacterium]
MNNDQEMNVSELCTPFAEQVEILFHEVEMAVKWQRPSILFAVYLSESVRTLAETALAHKLTAIGQTVLTIHAEQVQHVDLVDLISKTDDLENTLFFIDGLKWECNLEGTNVIKEINRQREFFIDASIRAIFWLKEDEVSDFTTNATECWILRHRVVDFTEKPKAEDILLSAIESVWESNPATSLNDLPLPSLSELLDLRAGPEMDIHYASNLLTLGILCWRKGDAQAGLKLLRAAQEIAELHQDKVLIAKAENSIGLIHASLGDVDNAIAAYTKSKGLLSGAKINWKIFGFLLYKRERYEEAFQSFKKALTDNPADHMGWLGLGQVFLRTRQYENAVSAFKKSLDIKPEEKRTLLGLGEGYLESGKIDAALLACKQALALDRNLPEAWFIMSRCHKKKQDYEQAIRDCENTLELDEANGTVWNELGNLYLLQKEYEKSVLAYQKAIELQPELGWAYVSMAVAYEKLGDYSKAILLYQQSVPLFEKDADRAAIWYQ